MDTGRSRQAAVEGTPESEAMKWSADELRKIIEADDLHISPFREDGVTPGTPTWIWAVAVDGDLYVRGYNGQGSRWYQAARRQKAGQITAAGATRNGLFEPVAGAINDRVDEAYRTKYRGSAYLAPMIGDSARGATIRIMPHNGEGRRQSSPMSRNGTSEARLRITIGNRSIEATLADSEAARDFASLLPLTLAMNDIYRREKFATLPRAISEQGKRTHEYAVGTIGYWPPGPDVAIFYRQDGERIPDPGLIVIGRIKAGVEAFAVPGAVSAIIERS